MSKIELPTITSGYNLSTINNNFQKIEDALNKEVLYRKGYLGEPNEMQTNLDMNGKQILNVTAGTSDGSLVTKGYVDQGLALKFDKSGGTLSGSVDMNNNEILNVSSLSTDVLEIDGVRVVPTSLVVDPYNGTREALRRSYADAGYNLVAGSFEVGGTLVNANDVLLQERTGKAFSGPAGTVNAGTDPTSGGFVDRSSLVLTEFSASAYGLHPSNSGLENCKALQALSVAVKDNNGGRVVFSPGDYVIGHQTPAGATGKGYSYFAEPCFEVEGLTGPLILEFVGAKFKWASGLRFGSFDPVTGGPINSTTPYYVLDSTAGIGVAFQVTDSDTVSVFGSVEIDGNDAQMVIGGEWGDKGRQLGHTGFRFLRNKRVMNNGSIYVHHHLLDGFYCGSLQTTDGYTDLSGVVSVYNARQGMSLTGGNNITVSNSVLGFTCDGAIANAPGFGVDIETEIAPIYGITFNSCFFPVGKGGGVTSDNFDVRECTFNDCIFESSEGLLLYMRMKGVTFNRCHFYGNIFPLASGGSSHQFGGKPTFIDCTFSNLQRNGSKAGYWPKLLDSVDADFIRCHALAYLEAGVNTPTFWIDGSNIYGFDITVTGVLPSGGNWMLLRGAGNIINGLKIKNQTTSATEPTSAPFIALGAPVVSDTHLSLDASGHSTLRWGVSGGYPNMTGWLLEGDWAITNNDGFTKPHSKQTYLSLARNMAAFETDETILVSSNVAGQNGKYYSRGTIIFNSAQSPGGIFGWVCTTTGIAGSTAVFKVITNIGA